MEIHDPPNLKLPTLKYEKPEDRTLIEKNHEVDNLIRTNRLLEKDFVKLLLAIKNETDEINALFDTVKEDVESGDFLYHSIRKFSHILEDRRTANILRHNLMMGKTPRDSIRKMIDGPDRKFLIEVMKQRNIKIKRALKNKSNKIQKLLNDYEQKVKGDIDI
jgi:hypothetical protein